MMQRIVITRPDFFEAEAGAIVRMLNAGADRVHIRKPGAEVADIKRLLDDIPEEYRKQITLHDGFELAGEYGVGGLHLNSRNSLLPDDFTGLVSMSCHTVDELTRNAWCDYLFLSPVFESISKPGYSNPQLFADFKKCDQKSQLPPVFALGGVKPCHALTLEQYGFAGMAMLGAAWVPVDTNKFRLQFITPNGSAEHIIECVKAAVEGGCRWVQLRMKDARSAEIIEIARRLEPICHAVGAVFLLDDRADLVAMTKADGVHLGKNDMSVASARRVLGPGYIIGATANTFYDIIKAWLQGADYIGLGPFRFTTTKKNLSPVLGLDGYREIISYCADAGINIPIVAIGGLDTDDFERLAETGVSGFAISGAIAGADNKTLKTNQLTQQIHNLPWTN